MISLRKAVEDYLTMRRSLGFKLRDMGHNLRHFVSFMEQQRASIITTELALRWAQQPQDVQPALWAARLSFVRSFARYWSATDPRTEIPPTGLLPYRTIRATPYIYSNDEIQQDSYGPRLHDLRHRFAVTTLLHWYRTGVDVEQRLPVLSTYLGHAHVTDTYWYLSAIPKLLALTKDRLEKRWEALS
jgi:site-specific recombinase XerD